MVSSSVAAARSADWARSGELARQALARDPRHAAAAYRLAVALFRQGQVEEAMTWAERSAELDPEDPLPVALQGDLYMRTGRFHRAAAMFRRALEIEPRFTPAQRRMDRLRERGVVQDGE
ncbi:MAG: tetratricopeptide repeat protein [Sandaracinaceae bacterium]|nr:MAG: tetratricopeptide repeat protein [Sandaracinaceae bacterium]